MSSAASLPERPATATADGSSPFQREARALGDPTRHALFRLIDEAPEPLTVGTLAEQLGVHVSAVRQHLAKLAEAGLIVEERRPPAGPGRPPARYRAAPAVLGRWGTESPYERLALLLLEVVRSGRTAREVGEEAGRLVVRQGVAAGRQAGVAGAGRVDRRAASAQPAEPIGVAGADPVQRLEDVAVQLGFAPRRVARPGGCSLILGRCPYAAAAAADATVCELHLGLAEGVAAEVGGVAVRGLRRQDPFRGGCRIDCRISTANASETPQPRLPPVDQPVS